MADSVTTAHTNGTNGAHSQPTTPRGHTDVQQEVLDTTLQQCNTDIQYIKQQLSTIQYNKEYTDDLQIYRFLKGYKFNRDHALEHIKIALQYRKEHDMDTIRQYIIENYDTLEQLKLPHATDIAAAYPHTILHGTDKYNQPLSIEQIGITNLHLLTQTVTIEQFLLYHIYHIEYKAEMCKRLSYKHNRVVRTAKIMDLHGLNRSLLNRTGLSYLRKVVEGSQQCHPELLGRLYLINAGTVFRFAWTLVKPMLNAITINKIQILGDTSQYQPILNRDIDSNNIPKQYNGTCTRCKQCVIHTQPDAGFKTVTVSKHGQHKETIQITTEHIGQNGCTVTYKFRTDNHNIAFRYSFQSTDNNPTVESPLQKYDCDHHMVHDHIEVKHTGTLTLLFDNSFSMFTSKTLHYMISVHTND